MAMERLTRSAIAENAAPGTVLIDTGLLTPGIWNLYLMVSSGAGVSAENQVGLRLVAQDGATNLIDQRFWHPQPHAFSVPLQLRVAFGERLRVLQEASYQGFVSVSLSGLRVEN